MIFTASSGCVLAYSQPFIDALTNLAILLTKAGSFQGLRDIDQRHALFARGQRRGHPVDDDVGATTCNHLGWRDVRATRLDRDIKSGVLVEALLLCNEVAGELGLRNPFELDG